MTDANGLLYMRARYYNPYLCRFINPDPAGFAGGLNWYCFADGNPISLNDPFGLCPSDFNTGYGWLDSGIDMAAKAGEGALGLGAQAILKGSGAALQFADQALQQPSGALLMFLASRGTSGLLRTAATGERVATAGGGVLRQTTILGENNIQRVMPFAQQTGARSLGFGATEAEWQAMTPAQRWRLNDGMLRARINEGDAFRYIGQDPLRNPALRMEFDLTRSELLRLETRNIPYEVVSPSDVQKVLGRP